MSGRTTGKSKLKAIQAAQQAREMFHEGTPSPDAVQDYAEDEPSIIIEPGQNEPDADRADESYDVRERSAVHVLYRIVSEHRTGLLTMRGQGKYKEAYFESGHPQFVRSDVHGERLDQYFVSKGIVTADELSRAQKLVGQFNGNLADTLVGLGFLGPLEAFRCISEQVRDKVVDVCTWRTGRLTWHDGTANPWPELAMQLDTFEIIGAGVFNTEKEFIYEWAESVAHCVPARQAETLAEDEFHLPQLTKTFECLDGTRTVGELAFPFLLPQDQLNFLRSLYLLVECELARL